MPLSISIAGNLESLADVSTSERYALEQVDICNRAELDRVFALLQPDAVMHLAAESHVECSITCPADFMETNIVGTYMLLEAARAYWNGLDERCARRPSASTISPPMRCMGICPIQMKWLPVSHCRSLPKPLSTPPAVPIQPPRPPATIWCAPGAVLLRPANNRYQLLQQLRPLSFPREADPAGNPQRAGWQAVTCLWQGRPDPGLALRGRPRARTLQGGDHGLGRRDHLLDEMVPKAALTAIKSPI